MIAIREYFVMLLIGLILAVYAYSKLPVITEHLNSLLMKSVDAKVIGK